jgi:hypothetical protein
VGLIDELPAGAAARNAAGWEDCIDRLAGAQPAPNAWQTNFAIYRAAFEPAVGPQEGPLAGYTGSSTWPESGARSEEHAERDHRRRQRRRPA